jgi:hypothetical protein
MYGGNFEVLEDRRSAAACALGQSLSDVDGIGIAVARYVNAADDVIEVGERIE